jgi:histidinol-phosphate aminotransferase
VTPQGPRLALGPKVHSPGAPEIANPSPYLHDPRVIPAFVRTATSVTLGPMAPQFVRAAVRDMAGYTPGEQPGPGERVVKLNTNENPFPPSPRVMRAVREVDEEALRRYPNPTADEFRAAAAKLHGLTPDMILAGNGSDDLLTIATRTFIPPGGSLAYPEPTYSLYPVIAKLQDAKVVTVAWGPDYSLPVEALLATKANAIYLANPNAPTGTFVSPLAVEELAAAFAGVVLVDEAYADFADDNCMALVKKLKNVVVSRSLSKGYGLAGLRFGYAAAHPDVIGEMLKVKDSYNCDAVSIAAATAAIEDQAYARQNWEYVRRERQRVSAELTQAGWDVLDSHANFVLAAAPDGRGKDAYLGLKKQGILVRHFDQPGLADKIRITIGTIQQNTALLAGVKELALGKELAAASKESTGKDAAGKEAAAAAKESANGKEPASAKEPAVAKDPVSKDAAAIAMAAPHPSAITAAPKAEPRADKAEKLEKAEKAVHPVAHAK